MAKMLKGDGLLVGTVHTQENSQEIALELCFKGGARNPIKDSSTFVAKNNLSPGQILTIEEVKQMKEGRTTTMEKHYQAVFEALPYTGYTAENFRVSPWHYMIGNEPLTDSLLRVRTSLEKAVEGIGLYFDKKVSADACAFTFYMKRK